MNERFAYLVEKYLEDDLLGEEVAEFEKYLTDPECAKYLKEAEHIEKIMMERLRELVLDVEKKEILKTFPEGLPKEIIEDSENEELMPKELFKELLEKEHRLMLRRRRKSRLLAYGSAAAVLISLLIFFIPKANRETSTSPPVDVFETYYRPFEFIVTRGGSDAKSTYERAESAYIDANYNFSANLCRKLVESGVSDPDVYFLYGLSLMALDSMRLGLQQFNTLAGFPNLSYGYLAYYGPWYAGLCYFYLGKKDSALLELDKIRGAEIMFLDSALVESLYGDIERARIFVEDSLQTVEKHLR